MLYLSLYLPMWSWIFIVLHVFWKVHYLKHSQFCRNPLLVLLPSWSGQLKQDIRKPCEAGFQKGIQGSTIQGLCLRWMLFQFGDLRTDRMSSGCRQLSVVQMWAVFGVTVQKELWEFYCNLGQNLIVAIVDTIETYSIVRHTTELGYYNVLSRVEIKLQKYWAYGTSQKYILLLSFS